MPRAPYTETEKLKALANEQVLVEVTPFLCFIVNSVVSSTSGEARRVLTQ
jgi:hypothetical protein